jgi:site-specific DNA-methyltransferase (adenine-specific)
VTKRELREVLRDAIVEAFFAAHDGYSIDWLLAEPKLQVAFHEACRASGMIGNSADWNRELLRLRKQGSIPKRGEIKKVHIAADELDAYEFAAEVAWQTTHEKFAGVSLDEIFCDPAKAEFFDRVARRFAGGFEPAQYRWAALRLRKVSNHLVNEVKQFHFIFTTRDFSRFALWDRMNPARHVGQPGIYLLRGTEKQPLLVGRAKRIARPSRKTSSAATSHAGI